jgi:hypothetical protein
MGTRRLARTRVAALCAEALPRHPHYLQRHNSVGLTEGRARVYANKGPYICIYDPKNRNKAIKPCAWTRREMLLK